MVSVEPLSRTGPPGMSAAVRKKAGRPENPKAPQEVWRFGDYLLFPTILTLNPRAWAIDALTANARSAWAAVPG